MWDVYDVWLRPRMEQSCDWISSCVKAFPQCVESCCQFSARENSGRRKRREKIEMLKSNQKIKKCFSQAHNKKFNIILRIVASLLHTHTHTQYTHTQHTHTTKHLVSRPPVRVTSLVPLPQRHRKALASIEINGAVCFQSQSNFTI